MSATWAVDGTSESGFAHSAGLPRGRTPYWTKDDAVAEIRLAPGEAAAVGFASEPVDGDLALIQVELADDSDKMGRGYREEARVNLRDPTTSTFPEFRVAREPDNVPGVVKSQVDYEPLGSRRVGMVEESLA